MRYPSTLMYGKQPGTLMFGKQILKLFIILCLIISVKIFKNHFRSGFHTTLLINSLHHIEIIPNVNLVTLHNPVGLCVFVQGTTMSSMEHKHEIDDLIRIYNDRGMNQKHVYYFMDKLHDSQGADPEEFCKSRNIRCIYIEYPNDAFSYKAKTFAMFDYVQKNKIYQRCDFMMKLDSDAYVDIPAYSTFLHQNYNPASNHYSGQIMSCGDKSFIQGTYVLSRGIFTNGNDINFTRDKDIGASCGNYDDAFVGIYLSIFKKIKLIDTGSHTLGFQDEAKNRAKWMGLRAPQTDCIFVCHKCANHFREEFASIKRNIDISGRISCISTPTSKAFTFGRFTKKP